MVPFSDPIIVNPRCACTLSAHAPSVHMHGIVVVVSLFYNATKLDFLTAFQRKFQSENHKQNTTPKLIVYNSQHTHTVNLEIFAIKIVS